MMFPLRIMDVIKLRRGAVDVQLENVRPIVVAGEIVPQLHLDAEIEIAVGIEDAFLGAHRAGDDAAQWIDDQRCRRSNPGLRRNFSPAGPACSISIMRSSTVPQAETTNALLICAKACESMATRFRSGSPLVGK